MTNRDNNNSNNKRKFLVVILALYLTFILISTIPYIAEQNIARSRANNEDFTANLEFPVSGSFGHYKSVVLVNNSSAGKINLKYTYNTNTLYIQKIENIKELVIDCELLYTNKYKQLFGKEPSSIESADFLNDNDGLFTVIINTNTPMEKLQFNGTPLPKSVKVNKIDWWKTNTTYYSVNNNDVTITYIPKGSTTVEVYFKELSAKSPVARFIASNYIALQNEEITFDASDSSDEDGTIKDYIWDLGDNTQNISKIIKHSYSEIGNYSVKLTVRDNDDLIDFFMENITVVGSNKGFKNVTVDDVKIDIRSVVTTNITVEIESNPPEIPEAESNDFNFFVNITSEDKVGKIQIKLDLGFIGGDIIPAGTDPKSIKLFYYNETLEKWIEIEDSFYDPITGILTAKLDHLTVFAPMSNEASSEKKSDKSDDDSTAEVVMYIFFIVIIVAILGSLGVVVKKRKRGKRKGKGGSGGKGKGQLRIHKDKAKDTDDLDLEEDEGLEETIDDDEITLEDFIAPSPSDSATFPGGEPQVIRPGTRTPIKTTKVKGQKPPKSYKILQPRGEQQKQIKMQNKNKPVNNSTGKMKQPKKSQK